MADATYQRAPGKGKFAYTGIELHSPVDLMPPGRAPFLLNVSPNLVLGTMQARPNITKIAQISGSPLPVHSIRRLNDSISSTFQRFVGVGTNLYEGQTSFSLIDSGYSGNPLSLVQLRPPQSPKSWLYVYDSLRQQKFLPDGVTKRNIGIVAPAVEPTTTLSNLPAYKMVIDSQDPTGYVGSGDAGAVSTGVRVPAATTIGAILYDSGTTGWALLTPSNASGDYAWLTPGMRVNLGGTENATVEQVFIPQTSTTIAGIAYDSGTTGLCTIQPTVAHQGLIRNQLIQVGGSGFTRVLSVTEGPDGQYSFRCSLSGTEVAGNAIAIQPCWRSYLGGIHTAGEAIVGTVVNSALTFSTGIGTVAKTGLNFDLTTAGGRPITSDDYMHVSFWCDNPQNIVEVHFLLDVDTSTNDFTKNYYYYVARQGDFTGVVSGTQNTIASRLQALGNSIATSLPVPGEAPNHGQSPYPTASTAQFSIPTAEQLPIAAAQWFEATFKIGDLSRVGSNPGVSLNIVKAAGIKVYETANVTVQFGSWWVGGGFGPDANFNAFGNQGLPIQYRYRYRSTESGALSELSPATRNGELPRRQQVSVTVTGTADPQVDIIDVERFGGTTSGWHRIGVIANPGATTTTFLDNVTEAQAEGGQPLELKQYQPWPVTDIPRTGVVNVVGTRVTWVSGDTFNTIWPRGVEVIIGNDTYSLHSPPPDSTHLNIEQNVGVLTNVAFKIPDATIPGTTLPYAWRNQDGRVFACGDTNNPGWLYFSNPDNPDTAADSGYIEVSDPSNPLIGGGNYEGADYAFTAQDVFRVEPTPSGVNSYASYRLSLTYGLAGPWAFTTRCPFIAYVSSDGGVYFYNPAGESKRLTGDLYPLFPNESQPGQSVTVATAIETLYPPDFSRSKYMRLAYIDQQLIFDYVDTTSTWHTFTYDLTTGGWIPHFYNPQVTLRYQEEGITNPVTLCGTADGGLWQISSGTTDGETDIECIVVTPADDAGDSRSMKQYGDVIMDMQGTVTELPYFNNFLVQTVPGTTIVSVARDQIAVAMTNDNVSLERNIGFLFTWLAAQNTIMYEWQPSWLPKPEVTFARATDYTDCGTKGNKWIQGIRLHANTRGLTRTVQIQFDGGQLGPVFTVQTVGEQIVPITFVPFFAHYVRLVPTDGGTWLHWDQDDQWTFTPVPEAVSYWVARPTSLGLNGYGYMRDLQFAYGGTGGTFLVSTDTGFTYSFTFSAAPGTGENKQYIALPPLKGKLFTFSALAAPGVALQIYEQDLVVRCREWGDNAPWRVIRPLGDVSNVEARI